MKLIFIFCSTTVVMADLIGFNRLGNNIKGHYQAKLQERTRSTYLKQLQGFMIANEANKFQSYAGLSFKAACPGDEI